MQLPKSRIPISYWLRLVSYTNTQTAVQETLLIIHIGSKLELPIPNQLALTFIGLVIEVPLNSWAANSVVCMGSNGLGLCRVQSMADFALPAGSSGPAYYSISLTIFTNTCANANTINTNTQANTNMNTVLRSINGWFYSLLSASRVLPQSWNRL